MADDHGCTDIDCCCDVSSVTDGSDAIEFGNHRLDPLQLNVTAAAFRLLDSGQAAAIASIAEVAGVHRAETTEVLDGFARTGSVCLTDDQVVGIAGLSVEPTRQVEIQGHTFEVTLQ